MGLSFSNLVQNERTVAIDINGNKLSVTYKPNKLSPAFMQNLGENLEEDDPLAYGKLFCEVISGWDLEGPLGAGEFAVEAGDAVPMEPEYVQWIPGTVTSYILEQVIEDSRPKSRKKR